ncbi:MAG: GNAT family N-acetyltransferase [Candidatus Heimdallarchaeota archaeon]|nr:GNAT family N-acetyltransferase [Candidatus Heimdallarchaeota archaeon]
MNNNPSQAFYFFKGSGYCSEKTLSFEKISESKEPVRCEDWAILKNNGKVAVGRLRQSRRFISEWFIELLEGSVTYLSDFANFFAKRIKEYNGQWLVYTFLEKELSKELEKQLAQSNFGPYFTKIDSQLDLETFTKAIKNKFNSIYLERWLTSPLGGPFIEKNVEKWQELYQLECDTSDDIPDREGFCHPTFQEFINRFQLNQVSLETLFIAREKETIVGLTYAWIENKTTAGIYFTGVANNYRRRGIGSTLKIALAHYLKNQGFKKLITNNKQNNLPILKTNQKLGFKPYSRTYFYRRKIC